MRIINTSGKILNVIGADVKNIAPNTISNVVKINRELINNISTTIISVNQDNVILVLDMEERAFIGGLGIVLPYINIRQESDLKLYNEGEPVPPGWKLVDDPYYIDKTTGATKVVKYLVQLPSNIGAPIEWETIESKTSTGKLVRFFFGTQEQYDKTKKINMLVEDGIYMILDTGHIYKGAVDLNSITDILSLRDVVVHEMSGIKDEDKVKHIPSVEAVAKFVVKAIDSVAGGLWYAGLIDATNPEGNQYWTKTRKGYYFRVTVEGVIDGVELGVGDAIIINKEGIVGAPKAEDMDVIPFTLDEIGKLEELCTDAIENLVSAINEVNNNLPRWIGINE